MHMGMYSLNYYQAYVLHVYGALGSAHTLYMYMCTCQSPPPVHQRQGFGISLTFNVTPLLSCPHAQYSAG